MVFNTEILKNPYFIENLRVLFDRDRLAYWMLGCPNFETYIEIMTTEDHLDIKLEIGKQLFTRSASDAHWFAYLFLDKERFLAGEELIKKSPQTACDYARYIIKGPWPEAEDIIITDPTDACEYAQMVIGGAWPKGEDIISKDGYCSLIYALDVLKKPFPLGESAIATNAHWATIYAEKILNGPFPMGESAIATHINESIRYATVITKKRFPMAENRISCAQDHIKYQYESFFNIKL